MRQYHPDKLDSESKELQTFKSIQKAYEILMDEEKRREYDSSEPFDDSMPSGKETAEEFFKVYGKIFTNNSKFSVKREVPDLGNENTPIQQVFQFYDWWYKSFVSWRSWPQDYEEYDLNQAESKEEKRWIKLQIEKLKKKRKQEEHSRIVKLIGFFLFLFDYFLYSFNFFFFF